VEESLESLLKRYYCPTAKTSPPQAPSPKFPSPTSFQPNVQNFKESPKSPCIPKFQPHQSPVISPLHFESKKVSIVPNKRRSCLDTSRDELPLGELSLMELADISLSFASDTSFHDPQPEPPRDPTPEPLDVKPDLSALLQRLQAVKARSRAMPSVLVKSELTSP
jgi:hypothetical protein